MSKFFKPVKYEPVRLVDPRENLPTEDFPEAEAFRVPIEKVHKEIAKMKHGNSEYYPTAIQFPKDICIPLQVLDRFYALPNKKNLTAFLKASRQEFGNKAAAAFAEWFSEIFPEAKELL